MTSGESVYEGSNLPEVKHISFGNREIRCVPLNWEHPKNERGYHKPLYGPNEGQYTPEEVEWMVKEGYVESAEAMKSRYMPDFSDVPEDEMGICAYETCTEGTPISPVFPDTPEGKFALLQYVTENANTFADLKISIEAWAGILFSADDVSTIIDIQTGAVSARPQLRPVEH